MASSDDERLGRIEQTLDRMDQRLDGMDQRLDGMDQRLGGMDQRLDGMDQRLGGMDQRLVRTDQTLDRVLALVMDHGTALTKVEADVRQIRTAVDGIQEGFREHLAWHLGHQ